MDPAATDGPEQQEAGQALAELQRVMDTALTHLSLDALLPELLERIGEVLAADSAAILLDGDGALRQRAAIGLEEGAVRAGTPFDTRIVTERTPLSADDDAVDPALQEHGLRSVIGVPLLFEDQALGVLRVGTVTPRSFSDLHRQLLQFAADRAARAIQHAQLYEQERLARAQAERSAQTVHALQRVTDAALAYLPVEELLSELLDPHPRHPARRHRGDPAARRRRARR